MKTNLIKKTFKQTFIILLPLSILSAFIEWKKLPLSILLGGILGLLNLKGLARGVENLIGITQRATGILIISSLLRLSLLALVLAILIIYRLVNILGILIGFTVVFISIVIEGLRQARGLPED
jgi:hypothetical protein